MKEIWVPIEGFEETYLISNFGRVFNKKRGFYLCPRPNNCNYLRVQLYKPEGNVKLYVHRLVAKYFCPGFKKGLQVNHKDGDKTNNRCTNLEWVTPSQNMTHAYLNGKCTSAFKPKGICLTLKSGKKLYFVGVNNFADYLGVCRITAIHILNGSGLTKNPEGIAKYI